MTKINRLAKKTSSNLKAIHVQQLAMKCSTETKSKVQGVNIQSPDKYILRKTNNLQRIGEDNSGRCAYFRL
jgi:hypothetical protein